MKRKRSRKSQARQRASDESVPYFGLFCLLTAIFLATALLTFSSADWPNPHVYPHAEPVHNACGRAGAWLAFHTLRLIGAGAYPLLMFLGVGGMLRVTRGPFDLLWQRIAGVVVLTTVASSTVNVLWPGATLNLPSGYAGALGQFFGRLLRENFQGFGTFLILVYCALAALLFTIDGFWTGMTRTVAGGTQLAGGMLSAAAAGVSSAAASAVGAAVGTASSLIKRPSLAGSLAGRATSRARSAAVKPVIANKRTATAAIAEAEMEEDATTDEPDDSPAPAKASAAQKVKPLTFRRHDTESNESAGCYPAVLDDWVLPPLSLLEDVEYSSTVQQETEARKKAKILEQTLRDFKIEAPVVEIETGPVITMFQLQLAPGTKVGQITALSNDIARSMRAPAVRVVATIAGKNTIGIEVPRLDREKVRLRELMNVAGKKAQQMALPLFLGKDASGNPMVYDLAKMPHLLIAGTTGSGKSVCINSIIMSLLMTQRPDRVKMVLIDPKMVELSSFRDIPHLMCPIVTDVAKAEKILDWACTKMDERYGLLAEAGVRNIAGYNKLEEEELYERFHPGNDHEKALIPKHLPYVVVFIDELADLMMTSGKEVEFHLARLAQKSRAVGIHIVVATQRPEAKVVTGLIKSNMPCRCAFRVAARMDSRIVLDQNGAEVLMGQGDMLFLPPGSATLIRAQGTFIEDSELRAAVADLRSKGKCDYHPELMQIRNGSTADTGERDPLFEDAVRIILESKRGSVSLLQRRLTVGYSRASRLIDQMAEAGIVGDYKGSQAREVLVTADDWKALQAQVKQDLEQGYEADYEEDEVEVEDEGEELEDVEEEEEEEEEEKEEDAPV
ncbi:MAG: DNA translocase FtsK 4TM domain-containing protein [Planctomycetes bacterium]|nr:DNA translocase FtsK 4TM domain-containing protein [Planctomycetota bacterium]